MGRIVNVRTSGRGLFLRCRRKWGWMDSTQGNLEAAARPDPFFVGSGFHYALEDLMGYQVYPTSADAFRAYAVAQKAAGCSMPDSLDEILELACGMLDYYDIWLESRDPLPTYFVDGVPQCEVSFKIPITEQLAHLPLKDWGIDEVNYTGTLDRMAIDSEGRLWIVEYKTAKKFELLHFETDRQISAYSWAASCLFDRPVVGVVYQQHLKALPASPRLIGGGTYSTDKSQRTTHRLYHKALKNLYGDVSKAPSGNIRLLNILAEQETENRDKFVKRDFAYRNEHQHAAEGAKILLEMEDYLNPDLPLYPNPTRDCSWDCSANTSCVLLDAGNDWEDDLKQIMIPRQEESIEWRKHLPRP